MRLLIAAAAAGLLASSPSLAATKIGTFGQDTQFFVDKATRGQEGTVNTVDIAGHLINQHGQPARYSANLICSDKTGTVFVQFAGKNWDMKVSERKTLWGSAPPVMHGYFAIYDRYCTAQYRRSPMSARDRKAFQEND